MTTDYLTPMEKTFEIIGEPSEDWRKGIKVTVDWLKESGWNV